MINEQEQKELAKKLQSSKHYILANADEVWRKCLFASAKTEDPMHKILAGNTYNNPEGTLKIVHRSY